VLVSCVILALRRHVAEIVVLVLGLGLIVAIVHITKAAIDRPRPPDPLVESSLSSFPSGHAAYATAWIAVALTLGRRRLGLAGETAWLLAAIALAAAVGLSRIYLRVHYWSDVAAGWAIGAGIFGLLAAIALVVEYIRHNGGEGTPERSEPPVAAARR
jgi:undecaprenyl-diphosphatase